MISDFLTFANMHYKSIAHPLAVASAFEEGSDAWIVGLFHDLLEDTHLEEAELRSFLNKYQKGELVAEIIAITRLETEKYFDYIRRLTGLARVVKMADLNQNLSRKDTLKTSLEERYTKALQLLAEKV